MPKATADLLKLSLPLQLDQLRRVLVTQAAMLPAIEQALSGGPLRLLEAFDAAVDAAERDETVSRRGRELAALKAGRELLAGLERWERDHATPIQTRAEAAKQTLLAPVVPRDTTERLLLELQRQEVRRAVQELRLDHEQRDLLYRGTTDPVVADALETGPPVLVRERPDQTPRVEPFVSPAYVEAQRLARAEAANPQRAAEVRELEAVERLYRSTVATARTAVLEAAPELRPVPPGAA
jgi:hypothetical protein